MKKKRKCKVCGKEFIIKHNNHYYCGEGCRRKYRDIIESGDEIEFKKLQIMSAEAKKSYEKPKNNY